MELTKEQVKSFKEAGYVFIEDLFKLEEIELMNNESIEAVAVAENIWVDIQWIN